MSKRLSSNIDDTITKLNNSKDYLDDAMEYISTAKDMIDNGTWEGKVQIETSILIDLCIKYHKDINGFVNRNIETINNLKNTADDFMNESTFTKSWEE